MGRHRRAAIVAITAMLCSGLVAASPVAAAGLPPSEWVVGPHKKIVFLTLDGKPTVKQFRRVLETLEQKRARASFFLPARWIANHRGLARTARAAGHKFGNRGFGTERFTSLSDDALRLSIQRAKAVLNDIGAFPKPYLRAPHGARDMRVLQVAGSLGYRSVHWTHNPGGGDRRRVQRAVLRKVRYGSIVSLDIARFSHRTALPGIIKRLRERDFGLATIKRLEHAHPVRWDVTLKAGSTGGEVSYLQNTLKRITYPAGKTDGSFGYATLQAVYAYEKANRLTRDGVVTPRQMLQIARATRPPTPKRKYHNFIDIDISRQVLFEVRNDKVRNTIPVSTGNEEYYESDGEQRRAHTPRGDFTIVRKIKGKRVSDLGTLYWPSYFVGGYAIHGSDSVPTYPASHGCVRIPRYVERAFWYRNPIGRPVFVHD